MQRNKKGKADDRWARGGWLLSHPRTAAEKVWEGLVHNTGSKRERENNTRKIGCCHEECTRFFPTHTDGRTQYQLLRDILHFCIPQPRVGTRETKTEQNLIFVFRTCAVVMAIRASPHLSCPLDTLRWFPGSRSEKMRTTSEAYPCEARAATRSAGVATGAPCPSVAP